MGTNANLHQPRHTSSARHVAHIPEGVPLDEISPVLCAGITVYKGLKESGADQARQSPSSVPVAGWARLHNNTPKLWACTPLPSILAMTRRSSANRWDPTLSSTSPSPAT